MFVLDLISQINGLCTTRMYNLSSTGCYIASVAFPVALRTTLPL